MTNICKYYKHPKGCTCNDRFKCLEQLYPNVCTSNLYYAMGLEQERKELKNNLHIANTNHKAAEQECDRYRKALEKIESICLEDAYTFADGTVLRYDSLDDILDIINKVKRG